MYSRKGRLEQHDDSTEGRNPQKVLFRSILLEKKALADIDLKRKTTLLFAKNDYVFQLLMCILNQTD